MLLDHVVEALHRRPGLRIVFRLRQLAVERFFDMRFQRDHIPDIIGNRLRVLLLHLAWFLDLGHSLRLLCSDFGQSTGIDQSADVEDCWGWLKAVDDVALRLVHGDL